MTNKLRLTGIFLLLILATLAGCGGGGSAPPAVTPAPAITAQPSDQSVVVGTAATFTVVASNASGYQWQSSTDGGASFTNVSAATSASHTTAASTLLDSGTKYRVVVAGSRGGNSVTSSAATLTVTGAVVAPSISVQPAAQTTTAGQNASFSVTASGTSLSYQWQRSIDGGIAFNSELGATNATLTLTAVAQGDNAQQFRAVVSNSAGSMTSTAALLTVNAAQAIPAFTSQPASAAVVAPNTATFSAVATGDPTPTLQWQSRINAGAIFADIAGANSASYSTPATVTGDSGKQYRVTATNASGTTTSAVATLTVSATAVTPAFTTQPASVTITAGQSTQFTVAASGTPTPTFQWQLSTDNGVNWNNITDATGTVFHVINAALGNNGRQFRAAATNSAGTVNSSTAMLTVNPAMVGRFAYVANSSDNTVSIYTVNAVTGQLRHNGYAATGIAPQSVTVDPAGKFAYVANNGGGVSAYAINAGTGALTSVGATVAAGTNPYSVTVDPAGRFAYVANFGSANVSAYIINATTGALTSVGTVAAGSQPLSVTVDPSGKFAYVATSGGSILAYTINATTGVLTSVSTVAVGTPLRSVTVDPSGRFAYAVNLGAIDYVLAYTINPSTGALTAVTGSPFAAGVFPISVTVDPTGKFAYVANFNSNNVSSFTINSATGALSSAGTVTAGINPTSVSVDPSGKFAFVTNQGSNTVSGYSIHATTGVLTALPTVASRSGPTAMAMSQGATAVTYTPKSVYTANYSSGTTSGSAYSIDAGTGALTRLADTSANGLGRSVAVDPTGKFAYTTHETIVESAGQTNFSSYTVNSATGALSLVSADAEGGIGGSIAIESSGRFLYIAGVGNGILVRNIDGATGALTRNSFVFMADGSLPSSVAIDPSGRFAYVANFQGSVSAYSINASTGGLTEIDLNGAAAGTVMTTGPNPTAITVDPSGKFVYVTHVNGVQAYVINTSGALVNASGVLAVPAGADPRSIAVEPSGRFAYVANANAGNVAVFRIHSQLGSLTAAGTVAAGTAPYSITVEASGKFAYVANAGSDNISAYIIDALTGALSLVGTLASGRTPVAIVATATVQ